MSSRHLMIASAALLAALGLLLSFAPEETLAYLGQPSTGAVPVLLQLAGALYLGFAVMNWTAKGSVLGGIYGRAIVLGNFLHFTMGAFGGVSSKGTKWKWAKTARTATLTRNTGETAKKRS